MKKVQLLSNTIYETLCVFRSLLSDPTHLVLVLERFDVAHELLERVLLLVEHQVLGELPVQPLHLLGHLLQNITLRARLLVERAHLLQEPESIGWMNGQLRNKKVNQHIS